MRLPALITRNLRLKALSVGLAVLTWGLVVYAANPPDSRYVQVPVPAFPQGSSFVLISRLAPLTVHVTGTRDHVQAFDPSSLVVKVAYQTIHAPGVQQVPVSVTSNDGNVGLDNPPTSLTVVVDRLDSREVPVSYVIKGKPPTGYNYHAPALAPDTVVVNGPSTLLAGVAARADIDLTGLKTTFHLRESVVLYDSSGAAVNPRTFSASPGDVDVTVEIEASTTRRTVPLLPEVTGSPAPGHVLSGITYDPQVVTLGGPAVVLNSIDSVPFAVSLNGLTASAVFTVRIASGRPGVTVSQSTVTVHVAISAQPLPSPQPTPTPTPTPVPTGSPT